MQKALADEARGAEMAKRADANQAEIVAALDVPSALSAKPRSGSGQVYPTRFVRFRGGLVRAGSRTACSTRTAITETHDQPTRSPWRTTGSLAGANVTTLPGASNALASLVPFLKHPTAIGTTADRLRPHGKIRSTMPAHSVWTHNNQGAEYCMRCRKFRKAVASGTIRRGTDPVMGNMLPGGAYL